MKVQFIGMGLEVGTKSTNTTGFIRGLSASMKNTGIPPKSSVYLQDLPKLLKKGASVGQFV